MFVSWYLAIYKMRVILHNIRSAHNVGSIFRTADAAGIEKIYLCGITPAPLDHFRRPQKEIAKTALGAQDYIAWEKVGKSVSVQPTVRLITELQGEGYRVLALEQSPKAVPYHMIRPSLKDLKKLALVVGYERRGLPNSIRRAVDKIIEIPMHGRKESLNVSVAFGIAVFSLISSIKK